MLCLLQWVSIAQQCKKRKTISTTYIDFYNNCQTLYSAYKCLPWFEFQIYVMRMCFNQASGSWWKSQATLPHTSQLIFTGNDSLNHCSNPRIITFFQKPLSFNILKSPASKKRHLINITNYITVLGWNITFCHTNTTGIPAELLRENKISSYEKNAF